MLAPRFAFSLSFLASGAVLLVSGVARAGDACGTDADCEHGFACQVVAVSDCATPACPPGARCPAPAPCVAETIKECQPGSCNAHSDCADGWVCYAQPTQVCTGGGSAGTCPPGAACDPTPPPLPDCTTSTSRSCVPRYALPCDTDASCGAGFTCVPDPESCACAGSAGTAPDPGSSSGSSSGTAGSANSGAPTPPGSSRPPSSDPVPPTPAPPPDCTCTPSTTKHCQVNAVTCTIDSDCPESWTCAVVGASGGSGCASGAEVLPDGGIKVLPTVCDPPPPPTETRQCRPANYDYPVGVFGSKGEDASGTVTVGTGTAGRTGGTPGGAPVPPTAGPTTGSSTGTGGSTSGNGTSHAAAPASSDKGSCQMSAGGGAAGSASVLGLLGLAGIARRRRTRWG